MTGKPAAQNLRDTIKMTEPVAVAGKKILADELLEIQNREEGTRSGEDIEDLHRMRVAARRSRVLLQAMRPVYGSDRIDPMIDDLKWLGNVLGTVRDIDTFVEYYNACLETFPEPVRESVRQLIAARLEERDSVMDTMRGELASQRFSKLKRVFFQFTTQTTAGDEKTGRVRDEVPGLILRAFKRVVRRREEIFSATPTELHQRRIRNKRLRYLCEFFQRCYDKRLSKLLGDFVRIQRILGNVQDQNRDIQYLQEHADIINFLIRDAHGEDTLNLLIDNLQKSKEKTQQTFYDFWREFALPENRHRIRYIIKNAIK